MAMADDEGRPPVAAERNLMSSSGLFSFTDEAEQGMKLTGAFFQASLIPYLLFLYFLAYRGNRISSLGNFGFQFVLLFVLMTIISGIVGKASYGLSLADIDWMHGTSESLLTVANILIVLGFNEAMANPEPPAGMTARIVALVFAAICFVAVATGTLPFWGLQAHSQLLGGFGNLSSTTDSLLPWVRRHAEPENALSIPTWMVHWSSVYEYLFAMKLIWQHSETTCNPTWKGLTWGMLPLHASSICAVTHHFFYNAPCLFFLVTTQAALTLVGNITCMIAAFRIARSNGWTLLPRIRTNQSATTSGPTLHLSQQAKESTISLAAKLIILVVITSYTVKYGELALDLPFQPNAKVALILIIGIPSMTALQYAILSTCCREQGQESGDLSQHREHDEESPLKSQSDKGYGCQ
jgi:hypothetical protein